MVPWSDSEECKQFGRYSYCKQLRDFQDRLDTANARNATLQQQLATATIERDAARSNTARWRDGSVKLRLKYEQALAEAAVLPVLREALLDLADWAAEENDSELTLRLEPIINALVAPLAAAHMERVWALEEVAGMIRKYRPAIRAYLMPYTNGEIDAALSRLDDLAATGEGST
jgi:hypothetical protein